MFALAVWAGFRRVLSGFVPLAGRSDHTKGFSLFLCPYVLKSELVAFWCRGGTLPTHFGYINIIQNLCKDNASEWKESLLSVSRVHVIFDKDTNKIITQASMSTIFYPYAVRWRFNMMLWAGDGCVSCLITPLYAMAERMKKRRCCEPLCDIKSYLCIRKSGAYAVWLQCFYYR